MLSSLNASLRRTAIRRCIRVYTSCVNPYTYDMAERITVTIHELVAGLDSYADQYLRAQHRVTYSQFVFLAALKECGPIDMSGLARSLGVTKVAVSKRVPGLVAQGWITSSPTSGRRILLSLTERAAELVDVAGGELDSAFADVFEDPRVVEGSPDAAFAVAALNRQLNTLATILREKDAT